MFGMFLEPMPLSKCPLSLRPRSGEQVPPLTPRIARAGNPDGTAATWLRDRLDGLCRSRKASAERQALDIQVPVLSSQTRGPASRARPRRGCRCRRSREGRGSCGVVNGREIPRFRPVPRHGIPHLRGHRSPGGRRSRTWAPCSRWSGPPSPAGDRTDHTGGGHPKHPGWCAGGPLTGAVAWHAVLRGVRPSSGVRCRAGRRGCRHGR